METFSPVPFSGFPPQALEFLHDLALNNNRLWFESHKDDYLKYVVSPAQAFVADFGERLREVSPGIRYDTSAHGSGSIGRVYKDIRFSKDKSPYNTRLRLFFWEVGTKRGSGPGYFVSIDPKGAVVHAGIHMFARPELEFYRELVADSAQGDELAATVLRLREDYDIGGEHFKRVPTGYSPDHPRAELLRYNGLWAKSPRIGPEAAVTPELVDIVFHHCREMSPLHRWLVELERKLAA